MTRPAPHSRPRSARYHQARPMTRAAEGATVCNDANMVGRRQLPWILSVPLMVAGSVAAHSLGTALVASRIWATADQDGWVEVAGRLDHGYVTSLLLLAGLITELVLVALGL